MTEKRFIIPNEMRVIKDTVTGKEAIFFDTKDGIQFLEWLNSLNDENEQLKQTIREAYQNERTQIGRNVLRQLLEAIQ